MYAGHDAEFFLRIAHQLEITKLELMVLTDTPNRVHLQHRLLIRGTVANQQPTVGKTPNA